MTRAFKLTAHDVVLLDKRTPDLNKANRGFIRHIKWTLNGKRKVAGRRYNTYLSKREHKLYVLGRRLSRFRSISFGSLWPHPDKRYLFYHNIRSIWVHTNYYGEDK